MNEEGKTLFSKWLATWITNAVFLAAIVLFVPCCQLPCSAVQGGALPRKAVYTASTLPGSRGPEVCADTLALHRLRL